MKVRKVTRYGRPLVYSPKQSRAQRPQSRRPIAKFVVLLVLVFGLGDFLLVMFKISQLRIEGGGPEAQNLINSKLSGHLWWNNLLFLPAYKLEHELMQANYAYRDVQVQRIWPKALLVTITERSAQLLWVSGGQTYAVDAEGVVIGGAQAGDQHPSVVDSQNIPVEPGQRVATLGFVELCRTINAELFNQTKIAVTKMSIDGSTKELDVTSSSGYIIKFDTERHAQGQIEDLKLVLQTLAEQKKTPTAYIDLRVPQKAYWR